MISFLAALAFIAPTNAIELPDPSASCDCVEVVVKLPELGTYDRAVVGVLAQTLLEASERFTRHELLETCAANGQIPRCTVSADHLRIAFSFSDDQRSPGMAMVADFLAAAQLPDDKLVEAKATLPILERGYWTESLFPEKPPYADVLRDDVVDMQHRLLRPGNVWVGISGPFKAGDGIAAWARASAEWQETPVRVFHIDRTVPRLTWRSKSGVSTIRLTGKPFILSDSNFANRLLGITMLGVGKGATLFQTLRQQKGWAYDSAALLQSDLGGLVPSIVVPIAPSAKEGDLPPQIREALTEAVKLWTEEDLTRALAMAKIDLTDGSIWSPLYVDGSVPVTASPADRTFLAAYWAMKTGTPFDADKVLRQMATVKLEEVRAQTLEFLAGASTNLITGN